MIVTLTAPDQIEAGGTIRFSAYFLSRRDGAFNPTGITATIYEGNQRSIKLATITPTQDDKGIGSYFADYTLPSTQGTGPIYCTWTGSYEQSDETSSYAVQATQVVRVTNPATWID